MNVRKKGSSQEIMVIKKKKTMGDIWWCNLCRIIQIPQSCSVDLNALTAVNLLRLAGSAWCQRVFTASALIIQSEKRWHSPITVPNHVWFLPTGFHHGCSSFPEHFKHLVMGKDCTFIQMWRKCQICYYKWTRSHFTWRQSLAGDAQTINVDFLINSVEG